MLRDLFFAGFLTLPETAFCPSERDVQVTHVSLLALICVCRGVLPFAVPFPGLEGKCMRGVAIPSTLTLLVL
jgi:hypothetical protein